MNYLLIHRGLITMAFKNIIAHKNMNIILFMKIPTKK